MKKIITVNKIKTLQKDIDDLLNNWEVTHGFARVLRLLKKESELLKNHVSGSEKLKNGNFNTNKIQIGGGAHELEGFLNIDIVPPADIIYDLRENIPLKNNCSEYIFSEHFFEHIDYPTSAKKFINECYRILKKGGKLIIGVPDGGLVLDKYHQKDKKFLKEMIDKWYSKRDCLGDFNTYIDLVNYVFRDQDDDPVYNPHYWAYDFEKLKQLVTDAGFSKVKKWKFDGTIAYPKREWGSIYIEATK